MKYKSGWILAGIFAKDQTFVIPIGIATTYQFMEPMHLSLNFLIFFGLEKIDTNRQSFVLMEQSVSDPLRRNLEGHSSIPPSKTMCVFFTRYLVYNYLEQTPCYRLDFFNVAWYFNLAYRSTYNVNIMDLLESSFMYLC